MRPSMLPILTLALSQLASAADGVLEINQTCAVSSGCFSGDGPGLPVTIDGSAGKSYVLTGDLLVPDENTWGIEVEASHVTVNLGGFEIRGVTACSGTPVVCSPSGTGRGVSVVDSSLHHSLRVMNGSVIGMGHYGVFVGLRGVAQELRATQNANTGILGFTSSLVQDNVADWNGGSGASGSAASTVTGNTAYHNRVAGVSAGKGSTLRGNTAYLNASGVGCNNGCTLTGNTAYENLDDGISGGSGSLIRGNSAHLNGRDGISGGFGATIIDNTAYENGDPANPTDNGIHCLTGCVVRRNTARSNFGYGLDLGTDSAYGENVVTDNVAGQVTGTGTARGHNYCAGAGTVSALCP